jgi:hypothetical protein
MTIPVVYVKTLNGIVGLARVQPIDPATGAPAVDQLGRPVFADWVQDPVTEAALGTPADAAWSGTGPASTIALLKALAAPTGEGTSATAGNQTQQITQATAAAVALGTPGDAAWSGSGTSTVVAALKAIWAAVSGTVKTQLQPGSAAIGSVSVSNLPATQPVSIATLPALPAGTNSIGSVIPLPVSANGTDASGAQPALGNVLLTFTVTQPGAYFVQNQSAATLQVVFDNGAGGAQSIQILAPGAGAGLQGADTTPPMSWFTGRIQVCGPAGSQFLARHN